MNKKKLNVMAIAALLSGICLVGCANSKGGSSSSSSNDASASSGASSASASSSEEKSSATDGGSSPSSSNDASASSGASSASEDSSDPDANKFGTIVISNSISYEIVKGEDNALNLDDYVTVKKVSSWSIVTECVAIKIEGHKIIGLQYGAWDATIIAGKTKRYISGYVVSADKIAFNEFFDSISDNYMTYSSWGGLNYVAKDYVLALSETNAATMTATFSGIVTDGDMWYSFAMDADVVSKYNVDFSSAELTFDPGYGQSKTQAGYGKIKIKSSYFTESLLDDEPASEKDSDGYTWFEYDLANDEADDYGDTRISKFTDALGLTNYWYYMEKYGDAASLTVLYSPDANEMQLYPVNSKGKVVSSITIGEDSEDEKAQSINSIVSISAVNEVKVDAVENWIANPVYPKALDVSDLKAFFDDAYEKKSYTMTGEAKWYNTEDGTTAECPKNMHYRNGMEALFGFTSKVSVNDYGIESTLLSITDESYCTNNYIQSVNSTDLFYLDLTSKDSDGKYAAMDAVGSYDASTGAISYAKATPTSQDVSGESVWDFIYAPIFFTSDVFTDEKTGDSYGILDLTSFRSTTVNDDGSTTYTFNTYGGDSALTTSTYAVGTMGMASMLLGNAGYYETATVSAQGWEDYTDLSFTLSSDKSTLTFLADFNYSEDIHFKWGWTISGVGVDTVSDAAKAMFGTPASDETSSSESDISSSSSTEETPVESSSAE
jgi:hypothetical protein